MTTSNQEQDIHRVYIALRDGVIDEGIAVHRLDRIGVNNAANTVSIWSRMLARNPRGEMI